MLVHHAGPLTEVFYARCLLLTQLTPSLHSEACLNRALVRCPGISVRVYLSPFNGCSPGIYTLRMELCLTSSPTFPVPYGEQTLTGESPCLSDFSAASEPATLESTFSLCPSPATLQPKLKPISQGFSSDYPRHAGKWTLVSGDQNRTYNKGSPRCGQQQWGEGGAHRVTSQKDCILGAAASSSRAWRHQTCQLKRPMNI